MLVVTRREFFISGLSALAAMALAGSGWRWLCRLSDADDIITQLPAEIILRAGDLQPVLARLRKPPNMAERLLAKIRSRSGCPAANILAAVNRVMKEDQRLGRMQEIDGWIMPDVSVELAQFVVA